MNIANVTSRFALLADIDDKELYKWKPIIEDACAYVDSITSVPVPDEGQKKRLEMLGAVYALRLYTMCNEDNLTSFTAGDVTFASSAKAAAYADNLWKEYLGRSTDIISGKNFLFGRVV